MPEATSTQMQAYADQRIRTFAESWELLVVRAREHKAAIDDVYARAAGSNPWVDNRTDPPHLMQAGNSVNPDDVLNFNAFISALIGLVDNTLADTAAKAAAVDTLRSCGVVLQRGVVRVLGA